MAIFTNKEDIKSWLDEYKIENYTINSDLSVDVRGQVYLNNKQLTSIPVQFNKVSENFYCYQNELISLAGSPRRVGRDFNCAMNQLTSLEGAPEAVGGDFNCGYNQLTNLQSSPHWVGGDFNANFNHLTSLKGAPNTVQIGFFCSHNKIESLEFCPQNIANNQFDAEHNPGLGEFQDIKDFSIIKAEHLRIQAILQEQMKLDEFLHHRAQSSRTDFKI